MHGDMLYFTAFFKYKEKEYSIFTHTHSILSMGGEGLRELTFSHQSGHKEAKENKLLFEYTSNSSNSLKNRLSKGLITATEEVWITDKRWPIHFHQQRLIKHSSHLFSHSNHPSRLFLLKNHNGENYWVENIFSTSSVNLER